MFFMQLICIVLCPQTNQRMSLARLQHEVEELRRRIEELKVKLTAEMKVCLPAFIFFFANLGSALLRQHHTLQI